MSLIRSLIQVYIRVWENNFSYLQVHRPYVSTFRVGWNLICKKPNYAVVSRKETNLQEDLEDLTEKLGFSVESLALKFSVKRRKDAWAHNPRPYHRHKKAV